MKQRGTLVSMDPQHDANERWTGEGAHLSRLLPLLDIFMPNEVEIIHVVPSDAAHSPDAALDWLVTQYPHLLVVLKLGEQGLKAARGASERWNVPAFPANFVDATGAGDACNAGFFFQILRDPNDVEAALRAGAAAGALSVSVEGACESPPTKELLEAVIATGSAACR